MVALFSFLLFTAFCILAAYWSDLFMPKGGKAISTSCGFTLIQFHPSPHEAHSPPVRTKWLCQCLSPSHSLSLACSPSLCELYAAFCSSSCCPTPAMKKGNICGMCPTLYRGFDVGCNPHCLTGWLWLESVGELSINSLGGAVTGWLYMYVVATVDFLEGGI